MNVTALFAGLLDDLQETTIFNKSSAVMDGQDFDSEDELFGDTVTKTGKKLQNGIIANGGHGYVDGVAVINESLL